MASLGTDVLSREGVSRIPGIAVGTAVLWRMDPEPQRNAGPRDEELARLCAGIETAKRDVLELTQLLPRAEAELFEPELLMLDELKSTLCDRLADGMCAEEAVAGATAEPTVDLLTDARARILDAMAQSCRSVEAHLDGWEGDVVLVTEALTPSVVASLPSRVVGIVASLSGEASGFSTSHAEILARERDIVLAMFGLDDVARIEEGDSLIVDTTAEAATIALAPTPERVAEAVASRHAWMHARDLEDAQAAAPLDHLGLAVYVNLGSLHERVPASAEGIGLVRTEILFSTHVIAPNESAQFGVVCAIASMSPRTRTVIRLFDGGGDKPIPWLPSPPEEDARGIALLLHNPTVLETQVRALVRAGDHVAVSILVPYVRDARDIEVVRALAGGSLPIGALVETVEAVEKIDEIASAADFLSIGTNDLAASITGRARANAGLALDVRLLRTIEVIVAAGAASARPVTVCGEIAGDAHAARVLTGLGVTAISVAPTRVVTVKRSLRSASLADCRAIARASMRERASAPDVAP